MPAYKDERYNTWYTAFYYTDWQGKRLELWILERSTFDGTRAAWSFSRASREALKTRVI